MKHIRDLQIAVQERSRRVLMIDHRDAARELRYITDWIASQALLDAIFVTAARIEPDLDFAAWEQQLRNHTLAWPTNTEAGRAWLVWQLLQKVAEADRAGEHDPLQVYLWRFGDRLPDAIRAFAERVLVPMFNYLSDQVGQDCNMLYVLNRYVRQVEWFDRDELYRQYERNTSVGERIYQTHLHKFLFSEGINMPFSEAKSASGQSDLLVDLDSEDPFVGEIKLFDMDNHGKREIASGLNQVVQYAHDWLKSSAYLVIINLSGRPLQLPSDGPPEVRPPFVDVSGVRVYFFPVRARQVSTASKQGRAEPVVVRRDDLLNSGADNVV